MILHAAANCVGDGITPIKGVFIGPGVEPAPNKDTSENEKSHTLCANPGPHAESAPGAGQPAVSCLAAYETQTA